MELFWIVLLVLVGIGLAWAYNHLVALHQARLQAQGDVSAQLTQRLDLAPQMAQMVARYMAHETDLLQALTSVRQRADGQVVASAGGQEDSMRAAMGRFFARAEAYPELRADATFVRMQQAMEEVEMHLAAARRALNSATARYNTAVGQFPINLCAKLFGFAPAGFSSHKDGADKHPDFFVL